MKTASLCLAILTLTLTVSAQEVLTQEQLEKAVPRILERAADQENLQLKLDGDGAKAFGMKAKDHAAVIIPNKGLTAESFKKLDKEVLVLGQLWLARLAPAVDGKPVPNSSLRLVKFVEKEKEQNLPLQLLGVQKTGEKIELVVYAKGKEPLLRLPLTRTDFKQELPLELDMRKLSDDLGIIDINIFGQFNAGLTVGLLAE